MTLIRGGKMWADLSKKSAYARLGGGATVRESPPQCESREADHHSSKAREDDPVDADRGGVLRGLRNNNNIIKIYNLNKKTKKWETKSSELFGIQVKWK